MLFDLFRAVSGRAWFNREPPPKVKTPIISQAKGPLAVKHSGKSGQQACAEGVSVDRVPTRVSQASDRGVIVAIVRQ